MLAADVWTLHFVMGTVDVFTRCWIS